MGDAPGAVLVCGCQGWDGGKVCSRQCRIQQVPGAGMLLFILGCRYHTRIQIPVAGGRYHAVMQKHVPGCRYCTGRQVLYWDVGTSTGMKVPTLGCRSCKPNVSSSTGMQLLY